MTPNPGPTPPIHTLLLAAVAIGLVGILAFACTAPGWGVGELAPRGGEEGSSRTIHDVDLELLSQLPTNSDSPSPAWSPSGERVAFTEAYMSVVVYNVATESRATIYSPSTASAALQQAAYNIYFPEFLSENQILVGPTWGGSIQGGHPGEDLLLIDAAAGSTSIFPARGVQPRLNHDGTRILLEVAEGSQVIDTEGQVLASYPDIYRARWSPNDNRIVGQGRSPNGGQTLVIVSEEGEYTYFDASASSPLWHPDGDHVVFHRPNFNEYHHYGNLFHMEGTLFVLDVEERTSRVLIDHVSGYTFDPTTGYLFFSVRGQLGISDLEEIYIYDDILMRWPQMSPSGEHLMGLVPSPIDSWMQDLVIYRLYMR